jgi:hypothetical protein
MARELTGEKVPMNSRFHVAAMQHIDFFSFFILFATVRAQ